MSDRDCLPAYGEETRDLEKHRNDVKSLLLACEHSVALFQFCLVIH